MFKYLTFAFVLLFSSSAFAAQQLSAESINGIYHLGVPERGQDKVIVQFGELGGKQVIAVAACQKCPPAVYTLLSEESKTLENAVFTTAGLYLFRYDDESFALIQPDGVLGRKEWNKIAHANIYSTNANKAKSISREQIESFAIALSKKIMNQDTGEMSHQAGTYYLAMPVNHSGRAQSQYQIEFTDTGKKSILITPCEKCGQKTYQHLPEESAIAGVDIYVNSSSYYLFDLKDGVLITTFSNASGLGKVLWGEHHQYNVLSNNQAYIRQILKSKEKQDTIDAMMTEYFSAVKSTLQERAQEANQQKVAQRQLPTAGLNDSALNQQALAAAKRWAQAWSWKETIKTTYFTGHDWTIVRNRLTGVITGRNIGAIVTMQHPDGRCRYQILNIRQDYDGAQYMNLHVSGIGSVYDLLCENMN